MGWKRTLATFGAAALIGACAAADDGAEVRDRDGSGELRSDPTGDVSD